MDEKTTETRLNIHQKISKIAEAAGVFRKSKEGYGYKYTPESDIQAEITGAMQKYGMMLYEEIVPNTIKATPICYQKTEKKTGKLININEVLVTADTVYTWVNTEAPSEQLRVPWAMVGQMEDASQAFGAGQTYCNRYFLMKSMQLATTEDDPDEYRSKQQEAGDYEKDKQEKIEAAALADAISKVSAKGSELINAGFTKEEIYNAVAKFNDGNPNRNSINSVEVCESILKEFEEIIKTRDSTATDEKSTEKSKKKTKTKEHDNDTQQ